MVKIADNLSIVISGLLLSLVTILITLSWETIAWAKPATETRTKIPSTDAIDLLITSETPRKSPEKNVVDPFSKDSGGQLRINLTNPQSSFTFGFGSLLGYPDSLNGPTRSALNVPQEETRLSILTVSGYLKQELDRNQSLLLEAIASPSIYGVDLRYGNSAPSLPGAFAANIFTQSSRSPAFENGDREVNLANGNKPWIFRYGAGVQYTLPITSSLDGTLGINYQTVSIRDAAFTDSIRPQDELGNLLTVSDDGQDNLLTLDLAFLWETTDNRDVPTRGSRLRFGISQAIPVGDANILYNRLSTSYSKFIPLNLFGFTTGASTLILNIQGGTFIGDVPAYQAFNLGGSNTIRGFQEGEVGTSGSFIKTTAEYRFPLVSLTLLKQDIDVGGTLFIDYGNDLATAEDVLGNPAGARNKPGSGLGYGFGLSANTSFGRFRGEFGWNDDGRSQLTLAVGDRF